MASSISVGIGAKSAPEAAHEPDDLDETELPAGDTDDLDEESQCAVTDDLRYATGDTDDELTDSDDSFFEQNSDYDNRPTPKEPAAADHHHHPLLLFRSALKSPPHSTGSNFYYEWTRQMDPKVYRYAKAGNIDAFGDCSENGFPFENELTPQRNTCLHLAAGFGHNELVLFIAFYSPFLIWQENYKGDLALHVAASGGHLSMLEPLLHHPAQKEGINNYCALKMLNKKGNTALHNALENGHKEVAKYLAEKDVSVSDYKNIEGKSPLCLAAEAGYTELVKLMTDKTNVWGDSNPDEMLQDLAPVQRPLLTRKRICACNGKEKFKGKSLLHAAIMGRNRDVLDATLKYEEALVELSIDEEGRTPLSFAAYKGYLDVVEYLLKKSTKTAYIRDRNGFFPIHMASRKGHIEIVREILQCCPDSRELLVDGKGQNIFHVAAMYGKAKMVTYMLKKTTELEMLINERDYNGNTPLHLATKRQHPKVVSILTWDKRVRLDIVNNDGLTAMDIAKNYMETMAPFRKRLTRTALESANAPLSERRSTTRIKENPKSKPNIDQFKDRINTLLLVSTLVATVTFAAGFTMPGGNNDSGQDAGIATFVTKPAFHAFFVCNTIAMYSSIIVVISLIFAQLGDLGLILTAFRVALPFLFVAVTMMSAAFMAGTYLVVSNRNWLHIVVLILGSIFFIILLALFILLYSPTHSHNYIARYILYYPFCWMILVTKSDVDRKKRVIFTDMIDWKEELARASGLISCT